MCPDLDCDATDFDLDTSGLSLFTIYLIIEVLPQVLCCSWHSCSKQLFFLPIVWFGAIKVGVAVNYKQKEGIFEFAFNELTLSLNP